MKTLFEFGFVALGGALGAMSRFGVTAMVERFSKTQLPLATFIANTAGCLLVGILIGSDFDVKHSSLRLIFGVGFLGALTTFSTFSAETIKQMNSGNWAIAFANIAFNLTFCLLAVFLGMILVRRFMGS